MQCRPQNTTHRWSFTEFEGYNALLCVLIELTGSYDMELAVLRCAKKMWNKRAVNVRVKSGWPWVSRWKRIALANAWACSMPLVLQMSNDSADICRFRGCGCSHCRHVICRMSPTTDDSNFLVHKTSKDVKRDPCLVGHHWLCLAPASVMLSLVPKVSMYGGAPKWEQVNKYRQGVHSIIACPGRLNDLLDGRQVQVSWCPVLHGECWRFQHVSTRSYCEPTWDDDLQVVCSLHGCCPRFFHTHQTPQRGWHHSISLQDGVEACWSTLRAPPFAFTEVNRVRKLETCRASSTTLW